ncbi:hypothetical protein [Nocardia arthritidis]|uniref:Uncharacterized protein n=1 Tax=Nocardia arthritidis TaxID=228602 RepID=A0A6G9YE08_9NOCA|nr:hypothetical protein [Nocardia arthritidis]QIS11461.1 hypothetical protein F5544_17935 [Nocardia arthritidis]
MTLYATDWTITSDITPEWAIRMPQDGSHVWQLSWLPGRLLTREQAIIGMELDELLSDPDGVYDDYHLSLVDDRAERIGILREHAIILLARRIAARLHAAQAHHARRAGPPARHCRATTPAISSTTPMTIPKAAQQL